MSISARKNVWTLRKWPARARGFLGQPVRAESASANVISFLHRIRFSLMCVGAFPPNRNRLSDCPVRERESLAYAMDGPTDGDPYAGSRCINDKITEPRMAAGDGQLNNLHASAK
jgi:hypothetical protein